MNKIIYSLSLSLLLATSVSVADTSASDDEWQFTLSPMFLWGMSMNGDSQIGPADVPLDLEFTDDVLSNLSAVFTVHFEAKKRDWKLFSEVQYADLEPSVDAKLGGMPISADITFNNTMVELGVARRVAQFDKTDLELLFGARYTKQQNHTKAQNGTTLVDVKETGGTVSSTGLNIFASMGLGKFGIDYRRHRSKIAA